MKGKIVATERALSKSGNPMIKLTIEAEGKSYFYAFGRFGAKEVLEALGRRPAFKRGGLLFNLPEGEDICSFPLGKEISFELKEGLLAGKLHSFVKLLAVAEAAP